MASLDILRKLIREEVRAAFQEQVSEILKEAISVNSAARQQITEVEKPKKPTPPNTLNTKVARPVAPVLSPGNPLNSLLAETAQSMISEDIETLSFNSNNALGFGGSQYIQSEPPAASSVEGMFASARPSSNLDMIQINEVPDFTNLMSNLKSKGAI